MALEITTVANLKSYLGIAVSTWDTPLTGILTAVETAIRTYCCRDAFTQAVYTSTFDGEWSDRLVLPNTPVDTTYSSQSVTVNTNVVDSSTYTIDGTTGILGFNNSWASLFPAGYNAEVLPRSQVRRSPNLGSGFRCVSVVYRGGYTTMPDDLIFAAWKWSEMLFYQRGPDAVLSQHTLDKHSYAIKPHGEIFEAIAPFLAKYRRCLGVF